MSRYNNTRRCRKCPKSGGLDIMIPIDIGGKKYYHCPECHDKYIPRYADNGKILPVEIPDEQKLPDDLAAELEEMERKFKVMMDHKYG